MAEWGKQNKYHWKLKIRSFFYRIISHIESWSIKNGVK